jgi:hypothetical protein
VKTNRACIVDLLLAACCSVFGSMDGKAFDLQSFVETAPTGIESPTEPIHISRYTFDPELWLMLPTEFTLLDRLDRPCENDSSRREIAGEGNRCCYKAQAISSKG